ncbi:MAG TPA: hypothetical protein VIZ61_07235 [Solirubrobacterales bacterium]
MTAAKEGRLSARSIFSEMWLVYRRHWRFLVPAAVVILIPQAVTDGILEGFHVEHIRSLVDVATLGVAVLTAAVNLMGQVVYSGLTAAAVVDWRAGRPLPPTAVLIRTMPIGRLIVLDIVVTLAVAVGFVLLIIPGLIVLTYLAPSAPVLKLEHLTVRQAIRRSVQLVRGRARQVFVIGVGVVLLTELAVQLVALPFNDASVGVLAGVNLIAEGIFQPIEGLALALIAIHLLELHGEAPAPDVMARALVAQHD